MKKMRKILCAVSALVLASMMSSQLNAADSSNFAGPYVGFTVSATGVELDGKVSSARDDVGETTTGSIGKTAIIGGLEAGYAVPLGESGVLLDIGISYIAGGAKFRTNNTDTSATADVIFEVDDLYTGWIAPSFALSDTSSAYIKLGYTHATISVTGDVSKPDDMEGATYAIGTRSVLDSGLFIRTEAGITAFDSLSAQGLGSGGGAGCASTSNACNSKSVETTTNVSADPTVAYGSVSIGMRF
jgi:hypothetical protein